MLNKEELINGLKELGLVLKSYSHDVWAIGSSQFANVMMIFNPNIEPKGYRGHVDFKVINASLFSGEQIKGASNLVHMFLTTNVKDRQLSRN